MNHVPKAKHKIPDGIGMYNRPFLRQRALIEGYRSGLEQDISKQLRRASVRYEYERIKFPYIIPASNHTYTPDFVLENGIIIETKGRWVLEDRRNIKLIKEQYPNLDLRMIFTYSRCKIRKGAKTTYGDVCRKLGIPYADKSIPTFWIYEKINKKSIKIIDKLRSMADEKDK